MHQFILRTCRSTGHFPKIHILTRKNSDYPNNNRQGKVLSEELALCLQGNSSQDFSTVTTTLVALFQPGFEVY